MPADRFNEPRFVLLGPREAVAAAPAGFGARSGARGACSCRGLGRRLAVAAVAAAAGCLANAARVRAPRLARLTSASSFHVLLEYKKEKTNE